MTGRKNQLELSDDEKESHEAIQNCLLRSKERLRVQTFDSFATQTYWLI